MWEDKIELNLRRISYEDRAEWRKIEAGEGGAGSCPVADFCINGAELSSSAPEVLV
jgi:hypothetical protein